LSGLVDDAHHSLSIKLEEVGRLFTWYWWRIQWPRGNLVL